MYLVRDPLDLFGGGDGNTYGAGERGNLTAVTFDALRCRLRGSATPPVEKRGAAPTSSNDLEALVRVLQSEASAPRYSTAERYAIGRTVINHARHRRVSVYSLLAPLAVAIHRSTPRAPPTPTIARWPAAFSPTLRKARPIRRTAAEPSFRACLGIGISTSRSLFPSFFTVLIWSAHLQSRQEMLFLAARVESHQRRQRRSSIHQRQRVFGHFAPKLVRERDLTRPVVAEAKRRQNVRASRHQTDDADHRIPTHPVVGAAGLATDGGAILR
jgi:hypothetical protein